MKMKDTQQFIKELEQLIQKEKQKQKKQDFVLQQNDFTEIISEKMKKIEAIDITIRFDLDK